MLKEKMFMMLVEYMVKRLSGEEMNDWMDVGLDFLEDKIEASDPVWDDKLILPMIQEFREGFGIDPDGED